MRPKKAQMENTHIEIKYSPATPVVPVSSSGPLQPIQKTATAPAPANAPQLARKLYIYFFLHH